MIGEINSRSPAPGGPASTGKQRCWLQRDTASAADGGGSRSETNSPPTTSAMTWVPIRERAIASSLSTAGAPVFMTRTETRCSAPSGSTPTVNAAPTSRRVRTSRPPSTDSTSVAGAAVSDSDHGWAGSSIAKGPNDVSHSIASSQVSHEPVGVISSSTGSKRPPPASRSARRCCSCRKRTTRVIACAPSTRNCAAMVSSSPIPASAAPAGPKTPHCQRDRFLLEVARYG